ARRRQRDFVLRLYQGDVRGCARIERQRYRRAAVRRRRRAEVQQVVDAGELLLDDLRDGLGDGLGVGARIARADDDLWRRDRRIRFDAERGDRDCAAEQDQDRDDPGEDRTVDEKTRHDG